MCERRFISPDDPERARRIEGIRAALRSLTTAPANRPLLWRLFQAAQEPDSTRFPQIVDIFRDVPSGEADLQAAAPLWVEHASRDLDPEGTLVARAIADKLREIADESRGCVLPDGARRAALALARVGGSYPLGGDLWRMIAEHAVQTLPRGAVLSAQRDLWKALAPQVAPGFRSVPTEPAKLAELCAAAGVLDASELNEQLRPFWRWWLAELEAAHRRIVDEHEEAGHGCRRARAPDSRATLVMRGGEGAAQVAMSLAARRGN